MVKRELLSVLKKRRVPLFILSPAVGPAGHSTSFAFCTRDLKPDNRLYRSQRSVTR